MSSDLSIKDWIAIEQARCLWRGAKTPELRRWYRDLYDARQALHAKWDIEKRSSDGSQAEAD